MYISRSTKSGERANLSDNLPWTDDTSGYDPLNSELRRRIPTLPVAGRLIVSAKDEYRADLISFTLYGTTAYWWIILDFNGIDDPFDLKVGKVIEYPSKVALSELYYQLSNLSVRLPADDAAVPEQDSDDFSELNIIDPRDKRLFFYSNNMSDPKYIKLSPRGIADVVTWRLANANFVVKRVVKDGETVFRVVPKNVNFNPTNQITGGITFDYAGISTRLTESCFFVQGEDIETDLVLSPNMLNFKGEVEETKEVLVDKVGLSPTSSIKLTVYLYGKEQPTLPDWLTIDITDETQESAKLVVKTKVNGSGSRRAVSVKVSVSDNTEIVKSLVINQSYEYSMIEVAPNFVSFDPTKTETKSLYIYASKETGDIDYEVIYIQGDGWLNLVKNRDGYEISSLSTTTGHRVAVVRFFGSIGGEYIIEVVQTSLTGRVVPQAIRVIDIGETETLLNCFTGEGVNNPLGITSSYVSDDWLRLEPAGASNQIEAVTRIVDDSIQQAGYIRLFFENGGVRAVPVVTGPQLPVLIPESTSLTLAAVGNEIVKTISFQWNSASRGVIVLGDIPDWAKVEELSISPEESKTTFSISALSDNLGTNIRSGQISFISLDGSITLVIDVTQEFLSFDIFPRELIFGNDGGTKTLTLVPDSQIIRDLLEVSVEYVDQSGWVTSTTDELKKGTVKVSRWTI